MPIPSKERLMLNQIAGMIFGMPYSGGAQLIKLDMTKCTDAEIINEIHNNLQVVNALTANGLRDTQNEMLRLVSIEQDVTAMRRLLTDK